jgi:hypothetical protein
MPKIIVTTDTSELPDDASVLLYEQVQSVHLSTGHSAAQLVERLAWAISDAENAQGARAKQRKRPLPHSPGVPLAMHASARVPIRA